VYRNGRSSRESFLLIFKDRAAEVEACYRKFYQEELPEALHWMPYAEALVRALAQRADILLGVVSNKMGPQLRREIQHAGVESLFQVIVGAQDAPANKPSPDPVHYALDLMGDQAGLDVWFVGDSPIDLECAHRSGCTSILVGPMVETAYAPHYHATSMEKLQLAVDSLLPASD
jgi:phosphoglycolate phosphatase